MTTLRRRRLALAVAMLGLVVLVGTASAGPAGAVKTFTGCLAADGGVINKLKEGGSPKSACSGDQTLVRLSGGDITRISVTGALTLPDGPGTGESGDVTIGLKAEFTLPAGCSNGNVAKWNSLLEQWECKLDNDTNYFPGTGLDMTTSGIFSIEPAYRVKNTPDCTSGQFATGFDSDGDILCSAPPAAQGIQGFSASIGAVELAGLTTVISKTLPAGNYILTAHVSLDNLSFDDDNTATGHCDIPGDRAGVRLPGVEIENSNVTITGAVAHAGGAVLVTCTETSGNIDVDHASMTAIKVDSLG
jgi:hypothetical protein